MRERLLCAACTSSGARGRRGGGIRPGRSSAQVGSAAQRFGGVGGRVINPASGNDMSNRIVRIASSAKGPAT